MVRKYFENETPLDKILLQTSTQAQLVNERLKTRSFFNDCQTVINVILHEADSADNLITVRSLERSCKKNDIFRLILAVAFKCFVSVLITFSCSFYDGQAIGEKPLKRF